MKSTSELTDYYYNELYSSIKELEVKRKEIVSRLEAYGFAGLVLFIILALIIARNFGIAHYSFIILLISAGGIYGVFFKLFTSQYVNEFKDLIIAPIIKRINENLLYYKDSLISRFLFERSDIFKHQIDRYSGGDYVKGNIDGVDMEFSYVHAEYKTRDSRGREHWNTLFNGIFFVAKFNKNFRSKIVILPDLAEKSFGSIIGNWLQSNNFTRDKLIKMDSPEFEKKFVVYGSDPIEANYVLSHSVMQRIIDFQKKLSYPIMISFVYNNIHIAIDTKKDLFTPNIFKSLYDYSQTKDYIDAVRNVIMLVDEFKLNEKIWS